MDLKYIETEVQNLNIHTGIVIKNGGIDLGCSIGCVRERERDSC